MKGKIALQRAQKIAEAVLKRLAPYCKKKADGNAYIEVVGSIRRRKPEVGDIELLVIPKYGGMLERIDYLDEAIADLIRQKILGYRRNKRGSVVYGPKNKLMVHLPSGIGVDIFSTGEECWWVSLVVRTGGKQTNIRISMAAQERGYQFHAYGSGFSTPHGEIVCRSEREVFEAVGLPYREPWERD